jgi:hypothetical protein
LLYAYGWLGMAGFYSTVSFVGWSSVLYLSREKRGLGPGDAIGWSMLIFVNISIGGFSSVTCGLDCGMNLGGALKAGLLSCRTGAFSFVDYSFFGDSSLKSSSE